MKILKYFLGLVVIVILMVGTLTGTELVKPAPAGPPAAKSILSMTQAERKAAYLARQTVASVENRARWACSEIVLASAIVPDSVEWTRRSTWPVIETHPGVYEVQANFTAANRMGVTTRETRSCIVKVAAKGSA